MVVIGLDPHKGSHTAAALEGTSHEQLDSIRVPAGLAGYRRLLRWATRFDQRRWAVEGASGLGLHVAQWLLAQNETVDDVLTTATARVRQLSRGRGRKTDVLDAAAAASVAALQGETSPVRREDVTDALALLDERRTQLSEARTRAANRLHALLRELAPGGAPRQLTPTTAAKVLAQTRPDTVAGHTRAELAHDLIAEVELLDHQLRDVKTRIEQALQTAASRLTRICGIGPVLAARLLGRTGAAARFPTPGHFASHTGTAPITVASGDRGRHRLSRAGDRKLNSALHIAAVTQARTPNSDGYAYYQRKLAEGKTRREALRCLKRRIADRVWRTMRADERHRIQGAGPGGHAGASLSSCAAG